MIVDTGEGGEWLLDPYNYTITDNESISFTKNNIDANDTDSGPVDMKLADLDGDGDLDIIVAHIENTLYWYENDGAANPSYTKNLIDSSPYTLQIIQTADLDGDGDLDIISAASNPGPTSDNHRIIWYENDGANNPTWSINTITSGDINDRYYAMNISDLDHDGDLDIIYGKLSDLSLIHI